MDDLVSLVCSFNKGAKGCTSENSEDELPSEFDEEEDMLMLQGDLVDEEDALTFRMQNFNLNLNNATVEAAGTY